MVEISRFGILRKKNFNIGMLQFPHLKSYFVCMNLIYNPGHKKFSLNHPTSNIPVPILLRVWEVESLSRRLLLLGLCKGPGVLHSTKACRSLLFTQLIPFFDIYSVANSQLNSAGDVRFINKRVSFWFQVVCSLHGAGREWEVYLRGQARDI